MPTITSRLDDWLDEEIRRFWADRGEGPSSGMRRVAREWWTLEHLPALEFRDGPTGRRARIRGGPDVWEVALLAREYGREVGALREHFDDAVEAEALEQAFRYIDRFPDEVEERLREHDRIERMLGAPDGAG